MAASSSDSELRNDAAIPDSDLLCRRILHLEDVNWVQVDSKAGQIGVTSVAFKPHVDEDGLSVYRLSLLESNNLGPKDIIKSPMSGVIAVKVGDVRALEL